MKNTYFLFQKLKQVLAKNGVTAPENKKTSSSQSENKPKEPSREKNKRGTHNVRKQAILERNRASSMRARAKKKAWIEQLQHALKAAHDTNSNLQNQVKVLHSQVERLKTLLLAHKDCPVTKAMEKGKYTFFNFTFNKVICSLFLFSQIILIKVKRSKLYYEMRSCFLIYFKSTELICLPNRCNL